MKRFIFFYCLCMIHSMGISQKLEMGVVYGFSNVPFVEFYPNAFRLNQAYADLTNLYSEIIDVRWNYNNPTTGIHVRYDFNNPFFIQLDSRFLLVDATVDVLVYSDLLPRDIRDVATFEDGVALLTLPTTLSLGVKIGERWKFTPIINGGLMMSQNLHLLRNQLLQFNPFDVATRSLLSFAPRTYHSVMSFGVEFGMMEGALVFERSLGRIDAADSQLYKTFSMISLRIRTPIFLFDFSPQKHRKRLKELRDKN